MYGTLATTFSGSTKTITVPSQATWVRLRAGSLFGGAETTVAHGSMGQSDGTHQNCTYWYVDSTKRYCDNSTTKTLSHWENVSGTMTEVLAATFSSWSATNIVFTVGIPNANYQVFVEYGD